MFACHNRGMRRVCLHLVHFFKWKKVVQVALMVLFAECMSLWLGIDESVG